MDNQNNYSYFQNQSMYYNDRYNNKNSLENVLLIHFLTFFAGFAGLLVGTIIYNTSQGKNRENIAHILNFYINNFINQFILILSVIFTLFTYENSNSLFFIFLIVILFSFILTIYHTGIFFVITYKILHSKNLKKVPFIFNFLNKSN